MVRDILSSLNLHGTVLSLKRTAVDDVRIEDCDELKNLAFRRGFQVTTSAINLDNPQGAMMMAKIIAPELVVNLMPPEFTQEE